MDAIQSAVHKLATPVAAWDSQHSATCIGTIHCDHALINIVLYECESGHRNYVVEVARQDEFLAVVHLQDVDDTIDALIDARNAITEYERTYLED